MKRKIIVVLSMTFLGTAAVSTLFVNQPAVGAGTIAIGEPESEAVKRSQKLVQTLDNVYKQTIVLITDKYVHDEDDFPAGSAAVALFANISKSGSHQVRLMDATGEPYVADNVAKDDFEREAIKQLKAGVPMHEKIVQRDGKYYLRAVTPVPVVMKKCVMCHEHYANAKEGEPIGAISYIVPIE